jgi:hypothetical protein
LGGVKLPNEASGHLMAGILLEDAYFCFEETFLSQTAPLQISTHLTAAATFIARPGFVQLGQR